MWTIKKERIYVKAKRREKVIFGKFFFMYRKKILQKIHVNKEEKSSLYVLCEILPLCVH